MRIASLQPSVTVVLHELGRLEVLCACTRYCVEAVPELERRGLPILQDSWSLDKPGEVEKLLETRPELVIASVPYRMESLAAILKSGLPLMALAPRTIGDIYKDIRLIAGIAGGDGEGVVRAMEAEVEGVRARTRSLPGADRPLIYCEEWGKPLIHSQGWAAELVEVAGARFAGEPGTQTSPDEVAHLDPDVLLFAWCGAGDRVPLARVIEQRGWQQMSAVRSGRVHCIPDQFLNTPAPSLIEGLRCIAAAAHPSLHTSHPAMLTLAVADRERWMPNV